MLMCQESAATGHLDSRAPDQSLYKEVIYVNLRPFRQRAFRISCRQVDRGGRIVVPQTGGHIDTHLEQGWLVEGRSIREIRLWSNQEAAVTDGEVEC